MSDETWLHSNLSRAYNLLASPDMPGVTFEQFLEYSDVAYALSIGGNEASIRLLDRNRMLPDYAMAYGRAVYGKSVWKGLALPRFRHTKVRELMGISYRPSRTNKYYEVGILGIEGDEDPFDELILRLEQVDLGFFFRGEPLPKDDNFSYLVLHYEGDMMYFPLDDDWRGVALRGLVRLIDGEEKTWNGTMMELPNGPNEYVLLDYYGHPESKSRAFHLFEVLDDEKAKDLAFDSLKRFYGAHLALFWLSTKPGLDIWYQRGYNKKLRERTIRFKAAFERELSLMAESEPTSTDIVASVVEQMQRIHDPLGRIVVMDELSKSLMDAVYQEGMTAAAEFREGDGTWREIGEALGVTAAAAQNRLDPDARARNAARARNRSAEERKRLKGAS